MNDHIHPTMRRALAGHKKRYMTRKPLELAMAVVQAECCVYSAWAVVACPYLIGKIFFANLAVAAAVLVYLMLFDMSGSRERAAQAKVRDLQNGASA